VVPAPEALLPVVEAPLPPPLHAAVDKTAPRATTPSSQVLMIRIANALWVEFMSGSTFSSVQQISVWTPESARIDTGPTAGRSIWQQGRQGLL
jgi:hypothetical protein